MGVKKYIQQQIKLINKSIKFYLKESFSSKFNESATYTVYPEGHRYRSLVGLEVYQMLEGNQLNFLKGVVGIEFIHHASLVFDDLPCMDNSNIRKNKPTAHIKFGEDIAILGGIYLLNKGINLIYDNAREHLDNFKEVDSVVSLVHNTIGGMLIGQELDLKKRKTNEELEKSIYQKNRLFHLACILPAYFLDKKKYLNPLNEIGRTLDEVGINLAIGYQLFDDLRDISKTEITGKPIQVDAKKNISVYRFGIDKVKKEITEKKEIIIKNIRKIEYNSRLENIINHILTTPS